METVQARFMLIIPPAPDLAPCDFWLFLRIKRELAGKPFSHMQDLFRAVRSQLASISKEEYRGAFDMWLTRLKKCIAATGDYFE